MANGPRTAVSSPVTFVTSPRPQLVNPLRLTNAEDLLALFDIHAPFHDAQFLSQVCTVAKSWAIKTVIIGGDLLDASVFGKWESNPDDTFEIELTAAESLVRVLGDHFDHLIYLQGNHEARITGKALQRQLRIKRFTRLFTPDTVRDRLYTTPMEWLESECSSGTWLWAHPKNASVIAGRVPNVIAGRSAQGKHVVSGHGHLVAMGFSDSGNHWAIDAGMCADPERIEYCVGSVSSRPVMMRGAVLIKGGRPYQLTPVSDFAAMARLYAGSLPVPVKIIEAESPL